jgi:hypothetical protein
MIFSNIKITLALDFKNPLLSSNSTKWVGSTPVYAGSYDSTNFHVKHIAQTKNLVRKMSNPDADAMQKENYQRR